MKLSVYLRSYILFKDKGFKGFVDVYRISKIPILKIVQSTSPIAYHLLFYPQNIV